MNQLSMTGMNDRSDNCKEGQGSVRHVNRSQTGENLGQTCVEITCVRVQLGCCHSDSQTPGRDNLRGAVSLSDRGRAGTGI